MARLFSWLIRIFLGLAGLSLLAVALLYLFLSRSLPDYDEDFTLDGISGPVEIVRDTSGVPHIFAERDEDVFFGLGFAHAQDRLWQMTMLRRTAQGRLSELFGSRTARTDEFLRRLDLYRASVRSVEVQSPETRAALEAYASGVNAWLDQVNAGARGRGAPEFWLFSPSIAPWQPADSIAIVKLMGLQLSGQASHEVLQARLSLLLKDSARVEDLLTELPGPGIAALPEYASLFPETRLPRFAAAPPTPLDPFSPVKPRHLTGASNAWAAAPSRSATGGTLLASDPHLELTAPSIWYLAHMDLETGGVIGGTIPGLPVMLVGRSDRLGWGITTAQMDDQDVHIEKLNPDNPEEVLTPNGYKPLRTETSILRIRDEDAVTITQRWSENGPVLPGRHWSLGAITPPGHVAALSWTVLSEQDTSVTAAMQIMRAETVRDAIAAGEGFVGPAQNLTLADRSTIAMKTIGHVPRRDPDHESKGRMPTPGWEARNRWDGIMPYADNPEFVAPRGGIVGNTNNKTVDRPFPNHVSYHWGDSQRVQRWQRLMQEREVHTRESFMGAQLDTVSFTARTLLPLVGSDLWYVGEAAPKGTPEAQRQKALDLMANWNGEMYEHLPEPLIYAAWMRALQTRLIEDELGPLAAEFTHLEPLFVERVYRNIGGAAVWCDVVQSARVETCRDIARMALDDAILWLTERYGPALESLRWGDAHEAVHKHPVLGETPALGWLVNLRQSVSGGDNTLLRSKSRGTGPDPFETVHGGAYRGLYDFTDPDSSLFIISTGQSGHPLSRHYEDLGERWRRGEYIPMTLDPVLARAGSVGTMTLNPAE
ncbi:penicillin acylase family protein [Palleronia caenipelagi]|uniref:Penicillin acylase family protein n=1 Tax=Palleronia caenipelagi TaxID=2489174 RepID=A0A547PY50_9RHOB|nr:penicillin acylase family protein [Palleronia caenipelagi]TRD19036.1 penicillin acylase family protein [Palleronia caenipelagi]